MAKMGLLYHLNLLMQDIQSKLNCLLGLAQYIPFLCTHAMKSKARCYILFGNKEVSQEFGCQSTMDFHCEMKRKKGINL